MRNKAVRRYSVRILCQEPVFLQGSYFLRYGIALQKKSVSDVSPYRENMSIAFLFSACASFRSASLFASFAFVLRQAAYKGKWESG